MAGRAEVGSVAALEKLTPRQPVMCFRERSMTRREALWVAAEP